MRKLFMVATFLPALLFFATPVPVHAGLVPCGANVDDTSTTYNETEKCTLCHIVKGISYLIVYIRNIMVFVALAVITAMGIWYIVSAGNTGMMETAKKGIWAALAGIAIVLLAWVVVYTIMYGIFHVELGQVAALQGSNFSFMSGLVSGFKFDCNATLSGGAAASLPTGGGPTAVTGTVIAGMLTGTSGLPTGATADLSSCTTGSCTASVVSSSGTVIGTVSGTVSGASFSGTYTPTVSGSTGATTGTVLVCSVGGSTIHVGETKTMFKALYKSSGSVSSCSDTTATDVSSSATWASSDAGKAQSVGGGQVRGLVAPAVVSISATYDGITDTESGVTVVPVASEKLFLCGSTTVKSGNTIPLSVFRVDSTFSGACLTLSSSSPLPLDGTAATFMSSSPTNATVGATSGIVTGVVVSPQPITITATSTDPAIANATLMVQVIN